MAGLFDNELFRFLVTPRAYFAAQDQAKQTQQFQGLLGGLNGASPGEQFWLQAAQLPQYQQLASQQLGYGAAGGQAMARQRQAQDWSLNNLTKEQQMAADLAQAKFGWDQQVDQEDMRRKWYGTEASAAASRASAGSSEASRALSAARLEGENLKLQRERGGLLERLPPQNQLEARQDLLNKDSWAQSATDVEDWALNRGPGAALPLVGTAEAGAMDTEWQTSVRPALMQIMNTGVLQEGEREMLEQVMGQPADKVLTKSQQNVIKTVAQKIRDLRSNSYRALGLQAPEVTRGGSAAARALSGGQPQGQLRPVSVIPGAANPGWRPEQRGADQLPSIWNRAGR